MLSTRTRITRPSLQEGQAIVLIALLILVLFGMLGLAIDSGRGYVDRRDQQTAVDASALAAGDWYENFPDQNDLFATVIPQSVALYERNLRLYAGPDTAIPPIPTFTRTVGIAPNLFTQFEWDLTFQSGAYALQILATNTQFNGYEFEYVSQHNLPLAFIQIFGGSPTIQVGAQATSIVGNQRQTPALLTLSTGPCATRLQGAGQLTMLGDAYTNGQACVDANLHLAGNCYAVDPTSNCANATYYCYSSIPGYTPQPPPCPAGYIQGQPIQPAPSLPDPGYLSPSVPFYNTAGNSYNRGNWTEMTPGTWNNFSLSSGGCYFLDAGIYQWYGGYTSHGALVSNELKPPSEVLYTTPGTTSVPPTTFWGTSQGCGGGFTVAAVPAAPGVGIKHGGAGKWGVEITSGRYDRFRDNTYSGNVCLASPGCWRESAPSTCQSIGTIDGNNSGIDVAITSNVPGAEYYSVYINPAGCLDDAPPPGGTRQNFSYYGTFLAPGWSDSGPGSAPFSLGVGPWAGVLGNGRNGWTGSCSNPLVTICGINIITYPAVSGLCAFYNTLTQGCSAPWDESAPHCFLTCALNTVPQDNAAMNLQYPPYNGGDLANENLCQQTPIAPSGDPNQPCTAAKVTPGAVQFYFPAGNNCLDQNGNGSTHVFSGEQYNWIVIYQQPAYPAATYCPSQKLNGNAYTQYIGTIYSPTSGWDILGSDTSPLAGQVIAWTATVTGSGNAGIDFNPNYSPAPPAARLIN